VGVEFTTMSKGYNMAGWRVGYCCGNAEMIRGLGHQGLLRLRHVPGDPDRRDRGAAAYRGGGGGQSIKYQHRRDVLVEGLRRIGWAINAAQGRHVRVGQDPGPWCKMMSTMDFAMMMLEKGDVAVSPGSGFGPAGEGYVRMALVENENRLRQAVRQIGRCLQREVGLHAITTPAPWLLDGLYFQLLVLLLCSSPARRCTQRRGGTHDVY
jgi:alanine-synthesizing transaminase